MQLKLNQKTVVWGLRDSDIFLTFENPGPIDINWEDLTELQKLALRSALVTKQVVRADGGEIPQAEVEKKEVIKKETKRIEEQDKDTLAPLRARAKDFIKKRVGEIKVQIVNIDSVQLLRIMQEEESKKKRPRKMVLEMLDDTINSILSAKSDIKTDDAIEITEEETDSVVGINPKTKAIEVKRVE